MREVLLIGTPNSGKTTLFNWLTGRNQKVVNYPGSTVDYAVGQTLENYGRVFKVYDSPGTYSLSPKSPEEEVTLSLLENLTNSAENKFSALIVVVDSTQVDRQMTLVRQLQELKIPMVVALTMQDLHQLDKKEFPTKELEKYLGVTVVAIDGRLGGGVDHLVNSLENFQEKVTARSVSIWNLEQIKYTFEESKKFIQSFVSGELSTRKRTEKIDELMLHPIMGGLVFVALMVGLFTSIFWLAAPLMDAVDQFFLSLVNLINDVMPSGLVQQFLADGIVTSIGAVLVFVPQIYILFLGISWLEDSGYLSRAAILADRPLSLFGLSGRSFVPMLSGFACAVPAILAARTISSQKVRWITVFIIPFMTCSARLPVYALLLSFLFLGGSSFYAGLCLALLYIGAIFISLISSKILNRVLKSSEKDLFLMELPLYRRPNLIRVFWNSVRRTKHYVLKSGPIIFTMAVLIWVMSTFPRYDLDGTERLQASYAGKTGQILEPLFKPMGSDWRVGVSLISAFAAREVFVSSLAVVLNVTSPEDQSEQSLQKSLLTKMQEARFADGTKLFTVASVVSLLVFFMIALQCMSTVGVVLREMGSWKFAVGQLLVMNLVAYFLAVGVFKTLMAMGFNS